MRSTRNPAGVCSTRRDQVEDRERQAELGIAHAVFLAHEQEQRREQQ